MTIFQYKSSFFEGQFSIISAFSWKTQKIVGQLCCNSQYDDAWLLLGDHRWDEMTQGVGHTEEIYPQHALPMAVRGLVDGAAVT